MKIPVILSSEMSGLFGYLITTPVLLGCSLVRLAGKATAAVWSDSGLHKPTKRFSGCCSLIFVTAAQLSGEAGLCFLAVFFEECARELDLLR